MIEAMPTGVEARPVPLYDPVGKGSHLPSIHVPGLSTRTLPLCPVPHRCRARRVVIPLLCWTHVFETW